ncbi:ubiquitin-protein ligase E3 [Pseudohyphozyma bogoriensis]|nr:ubiquitin-protein ligase E3 [Pseudohyphozyma bogoriensis]
MAKGKSSASSATRKKHAAKAAKKGAGDDDDGDAQPQQSQPQQKGGKKVKKDRFAPKVKSYVPPPPPPKGAPDPVDLYLSGGAGIDAELVVLLRRLGKKDEATVVKGVEGFEAWVRAVVKDESKVGQEDGEEEWVVERKRDEVVSSMAVWAHHFPRLSLHPSRRLRLLTLSLHSYLTSPSTRHPSELITATRTALLAPLWLEQLPYVGSWACSAFDSDRAVRSVAKRCWDGAVLLPGRESKEEEEGIDLLEHAESIFGFATGLVLAPPAPQSDDEDTSLPRTQALHTISALLEVLPTPLPLSTDALGFFQDESLWDLVGDEVAALRRATYELLGALVARTEGLLDENVGVVASKVLKSCWGETEGWAGVIAFLRRYPEAWTLADETFSAEAATATKAKKQRPSSDSDSEDDSDAEEEDAATPEPTPSTSTTFVPSPTLNLLLTHLTLGCTSQPSSYPTILLLLSTLPPSILPPTYDSLSLLFEFFWAAWGGRALASAMLGSGTNTPTSSSAPKTAIEEFVVAFLECLLFEAAKVSKLEEEGSKEVAKKLVDEWIARIWKTFLGVEEGEGRKRSKGTATKRVAEAIASSLGKLSAASDDLFAAPWTTVKTTSLAVFADSDPSFSLPPLALALNAFMSTTSPETLVVSGRALASQCVQDAAKGIVQDGDGTRVGSFLAFVGEVREVVKDDADAIQALDDLSSSYIPTLLATPLDSTLPLTFLAEQLSSASPTSRTAIWTSLFASPPTPAVLVKLIESVAAGKIPESLPSAGLDEVVLELAQKVLGGGTVEKDEEAVVTYLIAQPHPFISSETSSSILDLLLTRLDTLANDALSTSSTDLATLSSPFRILASFTHLQSNAKLVVDLGRGAIAAFEVADLLPAAVEVPVEALSAAKESWSALLKAGGEELVKTVLLKLTERLLDDMTLVSPIDVVTSAAKLLATLPSSSPLSITDLLPPSPTYARLFESIRLSRPSPALSVLTPLISQTPIDEDVIASLTASDVFGFSSYGRAVLAVLEVAGRDQRWLRRNLWVLPHVLLLGDVARDELAIAGSTTGVFGKEASEELLAKVVASADGLASYLLSATANELADGWHQTAVAHLRQKAPGEPADGLIAVLDELARKGREEDAVYARRAFTTILQAALRYSEGSVVDAERWLAWGQSLAEGSELTRAIVFAVKNVLAESPRFTRYQNELASIISGVPSSAASTKGLGLLRTLLATAPSLDAPIIFLPQQRSMFLIQRIQVWIGSDDDLDEEIHSAVAELFLHLAPIIQDLSGSHWDLVFDIIESNLETASWTEASTLPALYQSCRLLTQLKDLASSNKELKATAQARIDSSLELVRDLFVSRPNSVDRNAPRLTVLEAMAQLIRDLPPKLLVMGPAFDHLLRLLRDPSLTVQQSSYDLVCRIAGKHVADLVVEVELETEASASVELPEELIVLLSAKLDADTLDSPEEYAKASTYLFAWLAAFRFFDNASPRIKSAYIDQLRRLDLVATSFLPSVFMLLNLSDRTRPFDVTPWSIDEFHIELIDEVSAETLPVFATFVYYRSLQALPSLIRGWWDSCKNRQLHMAVSSFTSKHFSPVLIAHELAHLRDPEDPAGKALRDNDDFTVKVAAGANEVKAVFVVDEQNMEIGIRVPNEFPLHGVEVKDVRKVGVTDAQWRAWLLAVQQVVTTQNGLIADGLSLFKRNVTLHFEGVEACAICYSVISVVDRSLPTKACRTCNNRFHAGCLFKMLLWRDMSCHYNDCRIERLTESTTPRRYRTEKLYIFGLSLNKIAALLDHLRGVTDLVLWETSILPSFFLSPALSAIGAHPCL